MSDLRAADRDYLPRSIIRQDDRHPEYQYLDILHTFTSPFIHPHKRADRTGVGTVGLFGYQMRFDLQKGFPLLTTKKVRHKDIIVELLWFLRGDSNIKFLKDHKVSIWDEWADADGELGPVYGVQWRSWPNRRTEPDPTGRVAGIEYDDPIDQIAKLVHGLKTNPNSRRHIVSAWNPAEVDQCALPPCHVLFQFYTRKLSVQERIDLFAKKMKGEVRGILADLLTEANIPEYGLSCQLYQRSADSFLGVPYNIASYALLTHMVAEVCNMVPEDFVHTFGDLHLYSNHYEQARTQLEREPRPFPKLILPKRERLEDYVVGDFKLEGYDSHPAIKAPVAV